MVPEIWSATDRIFFFGPFFALLPPNNPKNQNFEHMKNMPGYIIILHMCTINGNHMIMVLEIWSTTDIIFVILDHFLPFYQPNNPENQNFEKMKKNTWRYYHFTHVHHK